MWKASCKKGIKNLGHELWHSEGRIRLLSLVLNQTVGNIKKSLFYRQMSFFFSSNCFPQQLPYYCNLYLNWLAELFPATQHPAPVHRFITTSQLPASASRISPPYLHCSLVVTQMKGRVSDPKVSILLLLTHVPFKLWGGERVWEFCQLPHSL